MSRYYWADKKTTEEKEKAPEEQTPDHCYLARRRQL